MSSFRFEEGDRADLTSRGVSRAQVFEIERLVRETHSQLSCPAEPRVELSLFTLEALAKHLDSTLESLSGLPDYDRRSVDRHLGHRSESSLETLEWSLSAALEYVHADIAYSKPSRGRPRIPDSGYWGYLIEELHQMGLNHETMIDVLSWAREPLLPPQSRSGDANRQREQAHTIITGFEQLMAKQRKVWLELARRRAVLGDPGPSGGAPVKSKRTARE